MRRIHLPLVLTMLLASAPLAAQPGAAPQPPAAVPQLRASKLEGAIKLDGRLDEPAWAAADSSAAFTQSYPRPGAQPPDRTVVRVLYGPDALYVGVRLYDAHPDSIAAQLARRDASGIYSDWLHVMIDTYHDRRTAFRFSINPRGVLKDVLESNDTNEDINWDAVWQAGTRVDSLGWTAELRIPYSQLRFGGPPPAGGRVWGFQIMRDVARRAERESWAPWTRQSPGFVSRFGDLTGLMDVRAPARLEVQPYASSRLVREPGTPGDPFHHVNDVTTSVGGDLKVGLPAGLTLSATINPDFGQVEVDPAVVNLTAYETFFPEKRPFFVEGADIFNFGQVRSVNSPFGFQRYFYSRRVGRPPEVGVSDPDAAWVDAPDQTTILGAGKVSGKSAGWTVGMMDALTARENTRFERLDRTRGTAPVEPLTNYFVGRVRRDLRGGQTVLGAMATATSRDANDPAFTPLRSGAYFGGVDGEIGWKQRVWTLSGYLARSRVEGNRTSILLTQLSSARYYQRPDADYLRVDSARTRLDGYTGELALQRMGNWYASVDLKTVSPGFELNDLGFMNRGDYRSVATGFGVQGDRASKSIRAYSAYVVGSDTWNFGGDAIDASYGTGASAQFSNLWSANGFVDLRPTVTSDRFTRGGPLASQPGGWDAGLGWSSDARHRVSANGFLYWSRGQAGDRSTSLNVNLDLRPSSTVHLVAGPAVEWDRLSGQYVRSVRDPLATETFGRRYVFADLGQTTVSLATRLDWTFTPTLSLQLYAQPFVAAGKFSRYKEFLRPRTYEFAVYGRDQGTIAFDPSQQAFTIDPDAAGPAPSFQVFQPDFNVRSLRGNAVLRWEYRPGSVLFFVWQQEREGFVSDGTFRLGHDTGEIFRSPARNVFLIKATYWIGH